MLGLGLAIGRVCPIVRLLRRLLGEDGRGLLLENGGRLFLEN